METTLKDGTVIHFTKIGVDRITLRDVYLADELLPVKFRMHKDMTPTRWWACELNRELDTYLLNNFDKDFIKSLKPDINGDIVSIPSIEELFNPPYDDIFTNAEHIKDFYREVKRDLGEIYWLKNAVEGVPGMFCTCCSLGGQDIQLQTNEEGVRIRVML